PCSPTAVVKCKPNIGVAEAKLCRVEDRDAGIEASTISQAKPDDQAGRSKNDGSDVFVQDAKGGDLSALGRQPHHAKKRAHKHGKEKLFHDRPRLGCFALEFSPLLLGKKRISRQP